MASDSHERARFLVGEARISGSAPQDALWLRSHIAECAECALYEEEVAGVVRGIESFAFDIDPAMNQRVYGAVAGHVRKPSAARWWALAAAAMLVAAAVPLYKGELDARRDKADAILMKKVESRVARAIPVAMEPLTQSEAEEGK